MCRKFINNYVTDNERVEHVLIRYLSLLGWAIFTYDNIFNIQLVVCSSNSIFYACSICWLRLISLLFILMLYLKLVFIGIFQVYIEITLLQVTLTSNKRMKHRENIIHVYINVPKYIPSFFCVFHLENNRKLVKKWLG